MLSMIHIFLHGTYSLESSPRKRNRQTSEVQKHFHQVVLKDAVHRSGVDFLSYWSSRDLSAAVFPVIHSRHSLSS